MHSSAIQHVSVWLDDASLDDATFPHALEWAVGLSLPIRAVATTPDVGDCSTRVPVLDRLRAWGTACAEKGVTVESHLCLERTPGAIDQFLRPGGLCVFYHPASSRVQHYLFVQSVYSPAICQLICSQTFASIRRVLILCHHPSVSTAYLETAARICQALETTPIILILANSEREAQLKQGFVEGTCNWLGLEADLDTIVHHDLAQVVVRVASWRSCSHLITARQTDPSRGEGAHRNLVEQFRDLCSPVSVLTLPEAAALDVPLKMRSNRSILRWMQRPDVEHVVTNTKEPI